MSKKPVRLNLAPGEVVAGEPGYQGELRARRELRERLYRIAKKMGGSAAAFVAGSLTCRLQAYLGSDLGIVLSMIPQGPEPRAVKLYGVDEILALRDGIDRCLAPKPERERLVDEILTYGGLETMQFKDAERLEGGFRVSIVEDGTWAPRILCSEATEIIALRHAVEILRAEKSKRTIDGTGKDSTGGDREVQDGDLEDGP